MGCVEVFDIDFLQIINESSYDTILVKLPLLSKVLRSSPQTKLNTGQKSQLDHVMDENQDR